MTGADIVDEIQRHVGNRTSSVFDDTWFVDRMNEAYRRLATFRDPQSRRVVRFPQFYDRKKSRTLAAAPSDNFVANQAGVYSVLAIWDLTNARKVSRRSQRYMMSLDRTQTGTILYWCPYGQGNVAGYLIWKLNTLETQIDEFVYNYPETLANGGIEPVIDVAWHEAIHLIGGSLAAGLQGIRDKEQLLMSNAVSFIRTHVTPMEEVQSGGGRRLSVMTR